MSVWAVLAIATGTAIATGAGVLPVLLVRDRAPRALALSTAVAAGFMLGASLALFYEGGRIDVPRTLLGALVGLVFIFVSRRYIGRGQDTGIGSLRGARGVQALLVVGVMTVHSFTEGAAIGVALAGEEALGLLISLAIAVHNIPEGVAISLTMLPHGERARTAAGWSIFSSLPQPLMAVPAFLAVRAFKPLLPAGLGFAGGAMVWMVFAQMVPDSMRSTSRASALVAVTLSAAVMVAFELAIGL